MGTENVNLGLNLTVPTVSTRNWAVLLLQGAWQKISQHKHTGSGDGNQIPTGGIEDDAITTAKLAPNIGFTKAATLTPAGTTQTIDFDNGNHQTLDLSSASGNVTLTLSNPQTGGRYFVNVVQGGTKRTLTWPAAVKFPEGEEPSQFMTVSSTNGVWLEYTGSVYLCRWELNIE